MAEEFTRGTMAIDNEGVVTDTLFCGEGAVQVTVVIPRGALGDYSAFDHQMIWHVYKGLRSRVEAIVKEKCGGIPTESCTVTLDAVDLQKAH